MDKLLVTRAISFVATENNLEATAIPCEITAGLRRITVTSIKYDSPLDLWDSAGDSSYIDDYYYGMAQYYLRMAALTILVGEKSQFRGAQGSRALGSAWSTGMATRRLLGLSGSGPPGPEDGDPARLVLWS